MKLSQQLLVKETRPAVVEDLVDVVQQEVSSKKGMSGTAIKAGYAAASRAVPNLTQRGLDKLLPDFAVALDPFWASYESSGGADFGRHLADRGAEVSAALLAVTDAKVAASGRKPVQKVYQTLRGKADGHVQAALPRVGAALEKHARPAS